MSSLSSIPVIERSARDAFGRFRVSSPTYLFNSSFQYDLQPLLFEAVTQEAGATVTHDSTNRNALMTFAATPANGSAFMQTYEHFRYQSGRSQEVAITFNFIETAVNTLKFVGYSRGGNGIELQLNGSILQLAVNSTTAKGNEVVTQANWNLDKLDGTGPSGLTLDITKTQIFTLDFQWLGVGAIRCGFNIRGRTIYVHQFTHANIQTVAYMATANLPIRAGMTSTGESTTTMRFICSSVSSEAGAESDDVEGFTFTQEGAVTAASGADTHVLSIRPSTAFNSISNYYRFVLESVDIVVTGTSAVLWKLCLGQAISGTTTFNDVNATYSATQFNTAGTISGLPAIVIQQGYVGATTQQKGVISSTSRSRYPITLDVSGAVRALGTLSVIAQGVGGASAMRAALNWREIR